MHGILNDAWLFFLSFFHGHFFHRGFFRSWLCSWFGLSGCIMDTAISSKNISFDFIKVMMGPVMSMAMMLMATAAVIRVSRCVTRSIYGCGKYC